MAHPIIAAMIKHMDEVGEGWLHVVSGHQPDVGWADVPMELFAICAIRALAEAEPSPQMLRAATDAMRADDLGPTEQEAAAGFKATLLALLEEVGNVD